MGRHIAPAKGQWQGTLGFNRFRPGAKSCLSYYHYTNCTKI